MAHNVIIAGGGFAGANAARELETLLPRQSTRLILVNDVNFLLYTPLLPEAAAGTLEPRHVVTPLRDILERTYLRLGAITAHDPAPARSSSRLTTARSSSCRYDQLLLAIGSVSRSLPIPGLDEHAIGFKSLADAIWLRNHVIETLEEANATEDPARREELLTYVFVGGGYAGLEALAELQDFAADAIQRYPRARLQGMRWILVEAADRVLPEIDAELAEYACGELRGRGIDIRLGTTLEPSRGRPRRALDRRADPDADRRLDRRRHRPPEPAVAWAAARRARPGPGRRPPRASRGLDGVYAAGDCAAVPDPDGGLCPPTAQHAIRQARVAARNMAADLGIGRRRVVQLPQPRLVRQPRPLQGGRQRAGRDHALGIPGLVGGADLPREPDPRRGPQAARGRRLDRRPAVRAATPPRSARSATRGRCARRSTSTAAPTARSAEAATGGMPPRPSSRGDAGRRRGIERDRRPLG